MQDTFKGDVGNGVPQVKLEINLMRDYIFSEFGELPKLLHYGCSSAQDAFGTFFYCLSTNR